MTSHRWMDTRRVQKTGRSSFVVTLPKIWINKNKILQNQEIGFIAQQDETLTIIPHPDQISHEREMHFHITATTDLQLFHHELFASYIIGYSRIIITSEERISAALRDLVTDFLATAIGFQITQEEDRQLTISNLIDLSKIKPEVDVERMAKLVIAMLKDNMTLNPDTARSVMRSDREINKLNHVTGSRMSLMLQDVTIQQKFQLPLKVMLANFMIALYLEIIGDNCRLIANEIINIMESKENHLESTTQIFRELKKMNDHVIDMIEKALNAWNQTDKLKAHQVIQSYPILDQECKDVRNQILSHLNTAAPSLTLIAEHLRKIGKIVLNLAFITIDKYVEEQDLQRES